MRTDLECAQTLWVCKRWNRNKQTTHESGEGWHKDCRKEPLQESVQPGDVCHQKGRQWTEGPQIVGRSRHASASSV